MRLRLCNKLAKETYVWGSQDCTLQVRSVAMLYNNGQLVHPPPKIRNALGNMKTPSEMFFSNTILRTYINFSDPPLYVKLETSYPEDVVPQDNVDESTESDGERYCFCREPGWLGGKFIECSNKVCKTEWFHLECVQLKKAPSKDCLCSICRKLDHWCICGRKGKT